jgi:hypothetical protein
LTIADIDRMHALRSGLQEAIGKATGRSAYIQGDPMADIDMESGESRREFVTATAHITIGRFEEGKISLR